MAMKSVTGIVSIVLLSGCVSSPSVRIDDYSLNPYSSQTPLVCREIEFKGKEPDTPVCDPSSAFDPNYPKQPPIREAVTIYEEGEYEEGINLPDAADITNPIAYTTFPENYPNGSRVLRLPVQVWPEPTQTSTLSTRVFDDESSYNAQGRPAPDLSGYKDSGWIEAEFCSGQKLLVNSYEKDDHVIDLYQAGAKLVAFSKGGILFIDKNGDGKFNHSVNDLCDIL